MSLDGLNFILEKREVVPTVSARDLLERAEQVEADYRRHVRTYVPISRVAEGSGDQLSVERFERRVIKHVKEARAPRGYLTAEYGYGKTSTALYLWDRAEKENLVVVPPFQMLHLPDLIMATHGWIRYRLGTTRPDLVDRADRLYEDTTSMSLKKAAQESNASETTLRQWVKQGRFLLDLQTSDYLSYFDSATKLVQEAGFDGLIILPDEIQQYIEPQMRSGAGDPIAPFFNLIQGLATREGYLCFGFILVIPLKEIGIIRDARGRGDLLDRMRELSLDLSTVYDQDFAKRLWNKLADEFGFSDIASDIVRPETLDALGEIASRDDLSNGPRTVINTFRRMVQRYQSQGYAQTAAYTPIDLVDDLLSGGIQFSGNNQIQNVTRTALQSGIVRADPERYEPALKLAAAYPNNGVPLTVQRLYGVDAALDELMRTSLGDLVIAVGPIDQHGVTLVGLDRVQVQREWLPQTIRDFRRAYSETHNDTRDRAIEVFETLLETRVFKGWKVVKRQPSTFTANRSIVFEGEFQAFSSRFPNRRVQVRILWEDEERKDAFVEGDVAIEYRLSIHRDLEHEQRRRMAQEVTFDYENHIAIVPINLMYVRPEGIPQQIQQGLQGVWSPYDLSPLVLMNIYQMLEEKRADGLIPKQDDQYIKPGFQPDLLDTIMRDLFNAEVGAGLGAAGERITEVVVERLLDERYGNTYVTLMAVGNWRNSLQKYGAALERLENRYQRRGEIEVEGTKGEIADLMVVSHTGLDSFMRVFGTLLKLDRDWPTQRQEAQGERGAVKFTLHPQEQQIMTWLRESSDTREVTIGRKQHQLKCIELGEVYQRSRDLGYQDDETAQLITLLEKRELAEIYQQHLLREVPSEAPDVEGVSSQLAALEQDLSVLLDGFPGNSTLIGIQTHAETWRKTINERLQSGTADPEFIYRLGRNIKLRQTDLRNFAEDARKNALKQAETLQRSQRPVNQHHLDSLDRPIAGSVSYVDQVNVLRGALLRQAFSVRGEVENLRRELEQSVSALSREDLRYEDLVSNMQELERLTTRLETTNKVVQAFEQNYEHLTAWNRLVDQGSRLYSDLAEMENVARGEAEDFDALSRQIRGAISSQNNKLDILPNHSIYETQLIEIARRVREKRDNALNEFNERQQRYRSALTDSGLYRRDALNQPFEYNFSNPGESNRLLEQDIQEKVKLACERMQQLTTRELQNIKSTLSTPYLNDIPEEDRSNIKQQGTELQESAQQLLNHLEDCYKAAQDIQTIRDYPAHNEGSFGKLIQALTEGMSCLRDLERRARQLGSWLTEFELTPEQEQLLAHLNVEDLEESEDLIEWRGRVNCSDDEFWTNIRGLYEKRRIRLSVSRVRY